MFKYYITLNTGDSKDVLVVDEDAYQSIYTAKNSLKDFVKINTHEEFRNNQKIIQRVINPQQVVSMNVVEVQEEKDDNIIHEYLKNTQEKPSYFKDEVHGWSKKPNGNYIVNSYLVGDKGTVPSDILCSQEFSVPSFKIAANPKIDYLMESHIDESDNKNALMQAICKNFAIIETNEVIKILKSSIPQSESQKQYYHIFDNIDSAIFAIETKGYKAKNLIISPLNYDILVKNKNVEIYSLDDSIMFRKNGKYNNVDIYFCEYLDENSAIISADKKNVGVMPIFGKPIYKETNIDNKPTLSIYAVENIGLCVTNPKAIAQVNIK